MKSSFHEKICALSRIAFSEGINGMVQHLRRYVRYKLKDQWEFVYFELPLDEPIFSVTMKKSVIVRQAVREDISRIESDIYPCLSSKEEDDKRYLPLIGKKGVRCFLAEKDDKLVHYSWVFDNALESPLMTTPIYKAYVGVGDVYLGPVYTSPHVRGMKIYTYSLFKICEYLKKETDAAKVLVLFHKSAPGAIDFYQRLGFRRVANACPDGPISAMKVKIRAFVKCF